MSSAKDLNPLKRPSLDLIGALRADGHAQYMGDAYQKKLGYGGNEMIASYFNNIMHPDSTAVALEKFLEVFEQVASVDKQGCLGEDGQPVPLDWSALRNATDELLICVGRDATGFQQAFQQVREQEIQHRTIIGHGFDMVALMAANGQYTYVGGATQRKLGYSPEELVGHSAFDFIHPDDLAQVQQHWQQLSFQNVVAIPDFRFRTASGEWRWVEATATCPEPNAVIRDYVVSSRDITERRLSSLAQAESEQRFRLLFDNDAALTVFQTSDGLILDANPAMLSFLKKQKAEVLHQPLADLLPVEVRALFAQKHQAAAHGQKVQFEAQVQFAGRAEQILKVTLTPLLVDEAVIGVHCTVRDVTEMVVAQRLIKQQATQLNALLESINDAFISLDESWSLTYLNSEAERLLNISREGALGKCLWAFFPEEAGGVFQQHYQHALDTGETVRFEAYFERERRWLEVTAYPFSEGLSVYFSDITDRVAANQQLKLLSLVARGTDNGVIITDAQGRTEWVNEAFTKHTGYTLAELLGRTPGAVLQGPETEPATVAHIRERMKRRTPFSVTILNYKKSGKKLWFSMDITPILNEAGQLTQFVAIQQNITYRKEIEASQAKMTQDLYRHNRDLQQFTYVISHNLRAPLANALGLATVLTKVDKNSDAFGTTLANLRQSMVQADAVLQDLNTVLSIRDEKDVLEVEPLVLANVCAQAIRDLAEPLQQCDGQVNVEIGKELVIRGNRAYLYSIFYNLLSNSIKYRSDERALKVDITGTVGPHGGPTITFTDNGSGFDMYKAGSDVFQLYKRFHTNQRGRGIGLFLVKAHVEAMGGKIEVISEVNFGTCFTIHLDKQ